VQEACATELLRAAGADAADVPTGIDGCGVVTWALPLERAAFVFSRLESLDGGATVAAAMRAHPHLVRGPGAVDTVLMESLPGWVAKGGAEGVLCASGPGGLGVALKVADGADRALGPAAAAFLGTLGHELPSLRTRPLANSRGERIGEVAVEAA
jgi:L-asparaginase II